MKARKKLKIAATIRKQLGKQITEVRGSEELEKKLKPNNPLPFSRQSEVYISIKTNASIYENICNNQIVHYDIHRVKSVNSNTEKVGISHNYFFSGMQDGACRIIYHIS